jgi:hypothetical protein
MRKYFGLAVALSVFVPAAVLETAPSMKAVSAVAAATHYVAASGSVGDGSSCASPSYVGATHAPIQAALNAANSGDTVHVCSGTYAITTRLEITKTLTLTGDGATTTTLDGGGTTQILIVQDASINDATSGDEITATVSNLSFVNGNATDFLGNGAECDNGNRCGGAIFSENESSLNVSAVHFKNNQSDFIGGAIARFIGNYQTVPSTVENSSFESNRARLDGGAIATLFGFGLTINRSTFYKNGLLPTWDARSGAAIIANFAAATVNDSTIVDHDAPAGITVLYGDITLNRTLVAQVDGSTTNICNSQQTVSGPRGNLVTDASCPSVTQDKASAGAGNSAVVTSADLKLGSFGFRGYSTKSVGLGVGSAALDHGTGCSGNDQVGTSTPQGSGCDVGAIERPATQAANTVDVSTWSYGASTLYRDAGSTVALVAAPVDAAGRGVSYSSLTTAVCTIDSVTGLLTLISDGTCTLSAASLDFLQRDAASGSKSFSVAATTPPSSSSSSSSSSSTSTPPTSTTSSTMAGTTTTLATSSSATATATTLTSTSAVAQLETSSTEPSQTSKPSRPSASTIALAQSEIARITTTSTGPGEASVATNAPTSTSVTVGEMATQSDALPDFSAPVIPESRPGEAGIFVAGESVEVSLSRANDQIIVSADEVSATIAGVRADGSAVALDSDGVLRLVEGDQIQVESTGFAPGSQVEVWLFSTPSFLGVIEVGSDGTSVGSFPLPEGIDRGSHRLALVGTNSDGDSTSLAVGVLVGSPPEGVSTVGKILIATPIILAVLLALILPARRRRKLLVR